MLSSPRDVVVGASDFGRMSDFITLFGFESQVAADLPATAASALYGLDAATEERLLAVPGAALGRVRVVRTPHAPRSFAPFDARPFAIDLFSTDVEASVALATENGFHSSPITDHQFGPVIDPRGGDHRSRQAHHDASCSRARVAVRRFWTTTRAVSTPRCTPSSGATSGIDAALGLLGEVRPGEVHRCRARDPRDGRISWGCRTRT